MTANANVVPIDPSAARALPAVGVSLQLDVGAGGTMVLQTHFAQEAQDGDVNRLLDKLMKAAERQKAKAEIVVLTKNIEVQRKQLEDLDFQMAEAEKTYQAEVIRSQERQRGFLEETERLKKEGYERHAAEKRRGTFVPSGAAASRINSFTNQVEAERQNLMKLDQERQKAQQGREMAKRSCEREIAANQKLIEERKALIGPSE